MVILTSLGLLGVSDVTTEQVTSVIKEYGGSAVMQPFQEDIVDTGLAAEDFVEIPDSGDFYTPRIALPSWADVKDNGIYKRTRDQEYGTCVYESYDILYIESLIKQGLLPVEFDGETFIDIDHAYFTKQYQPGVDSGTVPTQAYQEAITEGLPLRLTYQDVDSDNTRFQADLANKNDKVFDYRVKAPFKKTVSGYGADSFFKAYEAELEKGNNPMFRVSKRNHKNVAWYHETTPYIKSNIPQPSGGHSMAGAGSYGIFMYRGEPTVYLYESAGTVRYHLARLSVLRMVMTSWELYEVADGGTVITDTPTSDILATTDINFLERSQNVVTLQKYLISQNISIPAGATGFYGNQTTRAVREWKVKHLGGDQSGRNWDVVARLKYSVLTKQ